MHNNDQPPIRAGFAPKAPGLESARLRCFSIWHEMSTATVSRYGRYRRPCAFHHSRAQRPWFVLWCLIGLFPLWS